MTDNELLQAISDMIDKKLEPIKNDIADIKETVHRNYDTTLEFYGSQKEHNTEVSNILDIITGELDMHNNQIAKNTAALKRYK